MDGTGIQPIEDKDLAARLLERVNGMNVTLGAATFGAALLFASLPLAGN